MSCNSSIAAVEYLQDDDNDPEKSDGNEENEPEVHDQSGVWTYEWLTGSRAKMNKIYRFTKQTFDENLYPWFLPFWKGMNIAKDLFIG